MNKPRINSNWLLVGLALLLGAGAAFLGNRVLVQRMNEIDEKARLMNEPVRVVVAKKDLAPGDAISSEHFAVRPVPREYVNGDAVRPDQFGRLEHQRLAVGMKAGDMLLPVHADGQGAQIFSATLKSGRRAMTFEVDTVNSVSGMLRPGDRIDLMHSAKPADAEYEITRPLLSNLLILATDQTQMRRDEKTGQERSFSTVTLDLTPQEAQRIIVAKSAGRLTALLRHPDDKAQNPAAALSPEGLFHATAGRGVEFIVGGGGAGIATIKQQVAKP